MTSGEMVEVPLLHTTTTHIQKGGFRTLPFIIGSYALMNMATFALTPNLILYLMNEYHLDMPTGSNIGNISSAASYITPVIGAFMADSFVGRFRMIKFGSFLTLFGVFLFWLTSVIPQARPPSCVESNDMCTSATPFQLLFLCFSLIIISMGSGAVKSSSLAFGSDQLQRETCQEKGHGIESYFNWYYGITTLSILVACTGLVYIQVNMGWALGFGVPVLLMLVSTLVILLGTPFYVMLNPTSSFITGFIQVIVASYRNRYLRLPSHSADTLYHQKKGSLIVLPSEKLRFLNKACIVQDPQLDLSPDGEAKDPWRLCTVDQVEELKALLNVVPIWFTGTLMAINVNQSFPVLQATSMDRHIGSSFEIPAASFSMFTVFSVILWIVLYDRLILPVASKMAGKPAHFSTKKRMGFGLLLSFMSTFMVAVVEGVRRSIAIKAGYSENPQSVIPMSAMWLLPQNFFSGFAEALNAIGQSEFYISEFPRSMSSVASALYGVGMGVAPLLSSFILTSVDGLTKIGGRESWVSSNINKGHYDYYYLVLAGIGLVNLLCYIGFSRAYGPCKGEVMEEDKP